MQFQCDSEFCKEWILFYHSGTIQNFDFIDIFRLFDDTAVKFQNFNLDKSKMSAEYVEQLIQKLESLDLETEDKERIYFRRLEKSLIEIKNPL